MSAIYTHLNNQNKIRRRSKFCTVKYNTKYKYFSESGLFIKIKKKYD